MKTLRSLCFLLFIAVSLSACGVSQHGIRGYDTVSGLPDGVAKSVLAGAINADIPGAKLAKVGGVHIEIDPSVTYTKTSYDREGKITSTTTLPGGIYVSEVTRAQGEADKSRTAAGGDVALKTLFGLALPSLGGDLFGWLGNWLVAP